MKIAFQCPACGQVYEVEESHAGRAARCVCSATFRVPAAPGDASAGAVGGESRKDEAGGLESSTPVDAFDDLDAEAVEVADADAGEDDTGAFAAAEDQDDDLGDADDDLGEDLDDVEDLDDDTGKAEPVGEPADLDGIDEVEDFDDLDDDGGKDDKPLDADGDDEDLDEEDTGAFGAVDKEDESGDDLGAADKDEDADEDLDAEEEDEAAEEPELVVPQSWPGRILLLVALALFAASLFLPALKDSASSVLFPEGKSYRVHPMEASEFAVRDLLPVSDFDFNDDWGDAFDSAVDESEAPAAPADSGGGFVDAPLAEQPASTSGSDGDSGDWEPAAPAATPAAGGGFVDTPAAPAATMTPGMPGTPAPVTAVPEGEAETQPASEGAMAEEGESGVTGLELVLQGGAANPLCFAVFAGIGLTLVLLVLSFLGVRLSMVGGLVVTVLAAGAVGAGLFGLTLLETAEPLGGPQFLIDHAQIGMLLMLGGVVAVLAGGVICSLGVFAGAKAAPASSAAKGGRGGARGGGRAGAGGGKADRAKPAGRRGAAKAGGADDGDDAGEAEEGDAKPGRGGARKPIAKPAGKGAVKPALPGKKPGLKPALPAKKGVVAVGAGKKPGVKPLAKPALPGKKPSVAKPGVKPAVKPAGKKGVSTKAIKPPARKK